MRSISRAQEVSRLSLPHMAFVAVGIFSGICGLPVEEAPGPLGAHGLGVLKLKIKIPVAVSQAL